MYLISAVEVVCVWSFRVLAAWKLDVMLSSHILGVFLWGREDGGNGMGIFHDFVSLS